MIYEVDVSGLGRSFCGKVANSLFPKQVYLYGVLTPFKGLHPWAAWFCLCLRACVPLWVLWPHAFTLVSHLSPACLPLWVLWAACCCICFPLVSHLSPTLGPALGALGRMLLHLSPTCLPLVSHSGCSGPHAVAFVSRLSPTCLPLWVPLWVLWAACFYTCLPLVSRLSPTPGALGRMLLHLFPACLPLVSHSGSRSGCSGPHAFTLVSHLSPTLVSHSGRSGPHDFTLVSHTCLPLWVLGAAWFYNCFPIVSHSGWSGPHDFTLVSQLFSPALNALGHMILHLSPACFSLWAAWAAWFYRLVSHLSSTLGALGRRILHLSPTCLPLVSLSRCSGPRDFTCVSHLSPTLGCHSECSDLSPSLGGLGRVILHLSPNCFHAWRKICCYRFVPATVVSLQHWALLHLFGANAGIISESYSSGIISRCSYRTSFASADCFTRAVLLKHPHKNC